MLVAILLCIVGVLTVCAALRYQLKRDAHRRPRSK